ncbi:MAG: nitrile hydratase subunit beta [Pseudomonadota bacterium]
MDGIHDLGGRHGFGAVEIEDDEPVFHERWEAAVFTMTRSARAAGATANTDQFRFAIERIDPIAYLTHGYYGRWLGGLETLLTEAGVVSTAAVTGRAVRLGGERDTRIAARPDPRRKPFPAPEETGAVRPQSTHPAFAPGARVRTLQAPVSGHTRLPAYARGRTGTVVALRGVWVFPDSNAEGLGEQPQQVYSVAFTGTELWGETGEPGLVLHLDLFERYLEAADE